MPAPRHVLLCWPYDREGFVAPFRELRETGEFRFTHLYEASPQADTVCLTTDAVRYWDEFGSAQQVFDELRPSAVVLRGISSPRPIALNIVGRRAGIPTYVLQHGLDYGADDARRASLAARHHMSANPKSNGTFTAPVSGGMARGIDFLRSSMTGADLLHLPLLLAYTSYLRYAVNVAMVNQHFRFPLRMPTARICHSLQDAEVAREHDGPCVPRIVVGNPEYDGWFRSLEAAPPDAEADSPHAAGTYFLFIDSIVAAAEVQLAFMTPAQAVRVYEKVAAFASARGKKLLVKLHPFLPPPAWLPRYLPNVEWLTQADLPSLLRGSCGCFGYFSTVTLAACWSKPVCFLKHIDLQIFDDFAALGLAEIVDAHDFDPTRFEFHTKLTSESRARFEEYFFWRADGRSTERLGDVLSRGFDAEEVAIQRG